MSLLKGKYGPKLGFPEGRRGSNKKLHVGGVWIFPGTTQLRAMNDAN